MPDILNSGEWERVALPDTEAIELNLVSHRTPARLVVLGNLTDRKSVV